MNLRFFITTLILCILASYSHSLAQKSNALLRCYVKDENKRAASDVRYTIQGTQLGGFTNTNGYFEIPLNEGVYTLKIGNIGYENWVKTFYISKSDTILLNAHLTPKSFELKEFKKKDERRKTEAGSVYIDPKKAQELAGPIGGIEGLVKSLVGSNNELTAQYNVRGGNYDENLVYVNDFEIYRPFLVRSGQQEGLSFVNSDLTQSVNFSVGGFQSKYGDKMSSVLDIAYKKPTHFKGSAMMSLLGGSLHLEGISKNNKITYLVGLRQKSNQYLLQSQQTQGIYNPSFTDLQALVHYKINKNWESELILNYARNRFSFVPESSSSSFGMLNKAYKLQVYYNGSEIDQFDSKFGGYSVSYTPNELLKLKFLVSTYQTNEKETYDITGEYVLGELETDLGKANFGQTKYYLGTGIIQDFARNYLKVNVTTAAHRGFYTYNNHFLQWGLDATTLNIKDQLHQYQYRDSAGFSQPFSRDSLAMYQLFNASNNINSYRFAGFIQDNYKRHDSSRTNISYGIRYLYNTLNNEWFFSPRIQLGYKPKWENDISFKFAAGYYSQPAFYRELRNIKGNTNLNVLSQKSFHTVLGSEYNFNIGTSPFKLTGELYYKDLWDLVPYEYDGIKIRYYGQNMARGYAYGTEIRLYADLVKDATSWISIGLMKTEEQVWQQFKNIAGIDSASGYSNFIPRPTDQRFMLAMYFQDYLPQNKNYRVHLNLMYGTGLPFGLPDGNRTNDIMRMPAYKRVDIGFSALLLNGQKPNRPSHSFFKNLNSIWGSFEIFNLLDIKNTLSYTWIQDQTSSKVFAVPNRLTSRMFNFKIIAEF